MTDLISRADAIEAIIEMQDGSGQSYNFVSEAVDILGALPSAELTLQTPQTYGKSINPSNAEVVADYISREDAIALLTEIVFDEPPYFDSETLCRLYAEEQINTLPSAETDISEYCDRLWKIAYERGKAEAEPTVVRCKTMIPYGDFREWAKRIREDNPNVIVIPFDAEVVSADAVSVVRCKDCIQKHIGGSVTHYYWCDRWDMEVDATDYCAWAERREE